MTSCLPLMLLGSIPMLLQADVNDPAFRKLAEDQRPASSLSSRESIVDSQPPSKATVAPAYRRFNTFEQRAQSGADSFVLPDLDRETRFTERKRRARSVPVNLGFASEHESWIGDRNKGTVKEKGKQRASSFQATASDSSTTYSSDSIVLSKFKAAPTRRRSEPLHIGNAYSAAGPSYSSPPRKPESPRRVLPSPQLETLEEEVELETVNPALSQWDFPWSRTNASHEEEFSCALDSDTSPSSCRSLKRVSFSSGANEVIPDSDIITNENSQSQQQSTWVNMLFMNAGSSPRPPLTRQNSLLSVRGQAAGRSILKRTSSFNDYTLREGDQILKPNLKLDLPSTSVSTSEQSTQTPDLQTAPSASPILPSDEKSDASLLCDAYQATVRKAEAIVVLPVRPRKTKVAGTRDSQQVRHWSMVGSSWTRRSGIYASPRAPQHRMPQVPSLSVMPTAQRV